MRPFPGWASYCESSPHAPRKPDFHCLRELNPVGSCSSGTGRRNSARIVAARTCPRLSRLNVPLVPCQSSRQRDSADTPRAPQTHPKRVGLQTGWRVFLLQLARGPLIRLRHVPLTSLEMEVDACLLVSVKIAAVVKPGFPRPPRSGRSGLVETSSKCFHPFNRSMEKELPRNSAEPAPAVPLRHSENRSPSNYPLPAHAIPKLARLPCRSACSLIALIQQGPVRMTNFCSAS